jgi:serine/threonine-protein kinase
MPSEPPSQFDETLSLDQMRANDEVCARFEAAWKAADRGGPGPDIETCLADIAEPRRAALLRELIRIEVHYRHERGNLPSTAEFLARFPGLDPTWLDQALVASQRSTPRGLDSDETVDQGPTRDAPADDTARFTPRPTSFKLNLFPDLPKYEVLGELGRGGMGVVYKARQVGLDRLVALKMILAGAHAGPEELERFRLEGLAVAKLRHPQIVQIFDVGEHQGLPYFSLEFLEGGSLAKKLAGNPLASSEAAELALKLARGIAAAHQHRIIHRDLKPANILITADGEPKITDFGLAKQLEDDSHQTRTGAVMGTPSYMAPEQAWGHTDQIGPAADIYALGAILYELLTGRPPFRGASAIDTLDQVRHQEPVAPSQLVPKMPRDLETIALKALQKDPKRRYESAEDLADDLQRYLDGKPIQARPVSPAEQAWRWAKRNPWVASLSGAVGLLLLTIAVVSSMLNYQLNIQKNEALTQKTNAETARDLEKQARQAAELAQRKEAEARARADKNYEEALQQNSLALDAVRGVIVNLDNSLRRNPSTLRLREQLVTLALRDLDKVKERALANPLYDRDTARILARMGDIYLENNRVQNAAELYERAGTLLERFARDNPNDPVGVRNVAAISNKQAEAVLRLGEGAKARELYLKGLELRREWARRLPGFAEARKAIAESHGYLGNVAVKLGDPVAARRHYEESVKEYAELPPEIADQPLTRRDRAIQEAALGDVVLKLEDTDEAERWLRAALQQREALLKSLPRNLTLIRDVALSRLGLGDLLLTARNDPVTAWAEYAQAHKAFVQLHQADTENLSARRDLAKILYRLGETARRLEATRIATETTPGRFTAQKYFEECLTLRDALARIDPTDTQARIDWMLALARCGRTDEAEPLIDSLLETARGDARLLFQAACGLALCSTSNDRETARRARDRAFAVLADLIRNGWKDRFALRTDPDLEPIRGDDRFAPLIAQLGQTG